MRACNHSAKEKASSLSRTTLRVKDIKILMDCGDLKASKFASSFKQWFFEQNGYETYCIPTEEFIQYTHYPEKRVLKYAELGF